jgi:hypothetical protein
MSSASPAVPRWVVTVSGVLSLLGLVGLLLTLVLGFETPDTTLLAVSAPLMFAAPLVALWHFVTTRTLTPAEKRIWIKELTGAEAFSALSEYMRSTDLRASAQRRAADAATRRTANNHT